ncbi:MAG: calcium-binding protein, partial [Selenomonadaceae bacterium]|nr:calcium-binding protein [Selenomonadaceae bacterium]
MATQQEVIKTFMQSLDNSTLKGAAAINQAIRASSDFKNFNAVRRKFIADLKAAKNWHTFLVEKCGIILDNKDTGAISGADAGGSEVKTADNLLPATGDAQYPDGTSFTVEGVTIYGVPPKDTLTDDEQYVVQGLYSWWLRDALKLIKESYGLSFTDAGTTNSRLKLKLVNEPDANYLAYVNFDSEDGTDYESRILCVNMAFFKDMNPDDRHGTSDKQQLDRVLAHEFVHGLMASNVVGLMDLPPFFIEGGSAELVHGVDDMRYNRIIQTVKDTAAFEDILTTDGFPSDPDYVETIELYSGGYIFMRYFAKQAATDTTFDYDTYHRTVGVDSLNFATNYHDTVTMRGSSNSDTITNSGSNVSINAGKGKDTIKTYSDTVTVNAGKGSDFILNEGEYVSIFGGTGKDTIKNIGADATIDGGDGNDSIQNQGAFSKVYGGAGNDIILNSNNYSTADTFATSLEGFKASIYGGAGDDSITNTEGYVKIYGQDGADNIVNSGTWVSLYGGNGDDSFTNTVEKVRIYGQSGADSIYNTGRKASILGGKGNDFISNTSSAEDDSVTTSGDNSILDGGSGNDTIENTAANVSIFAGKGNDTVENSGAGAVIDLGAGNDTLHNTGSSDIIYGDNGKDRITNIGDGISILGGADNDSIYNWGDLSSLRGDAGNDYIANDGNSVTSEGGAGNDYIRNEGSKVYILGGAGNDSIRNYGDRVTLSGGKGNDYVKNSGGKHITYRFAKNAGNDTVVGFNSSDTVQIVSGTYSASTSGKDVVVKVGASTLTLK